MVEILDVERILDGQLGVPSAQAVAAALSVGSSLSGQFLTAAGASVNVIERLLQSLLSCEGF